ncbi:helix-turn-helix domain-containing protein [Methylibium petroleiphilum]
MMFSNNDTTLDRSNVACQHSTVVTTVRFVPTYKRRALTKEEQADATRLRALFDAQKQSSGLTQEQLAAKCGWEGQSSAAAYLNGRIALNLKAVTAFARALDVSIRDISPRLAEEASQFFSSVGAASSDDVDRRPGLSVALQDWRLKASPRSLAVIDQLTLLAKKNQLKDDDWLLIEQLAARFKLR